jgi:hypothetical protein
VSPVKYELGFYIPEDDILHSHRRGNPSMRFVCYRDVAFYLFLYKQVESERNSPRIINTHYYLHAYFTYSPCEDDKEDLVSEVKGNEESYRTCYGWAE